jgi:hypothetical protein
MYIKKGDARMKELTQKYIEQCENVIKSNNRDSAKKLQSNIIAAFESQIKEISRDLDFDWPDINDMGYDHYGDYISNIEKLKCKLEVFLATGCLNQNEKQFDKSVNIKLDNSSNNSSINNNTNNNTNDVDFKLIFNNARKETEDNESLTEAETQEVINKIDEIEEINKLDESKKKKWDRLKPTMQWLGTKGISVATTVLNLITAILKFPSK